MLFRRNVSRETFLFFAGKFKDFPTKNAPLSVHIIHDYMEYV